MPASGSILGNAVRRGRGPPHPAGRERVLRRPRDRRARPRRVRAVDRRPRTVTGVDTADAESMPGVLARPHRRRRSRCPTDPGLRHAAAGVQPAAARERRGALRRRHRRRGRRRDPRPGGRRGRGGHRRLRPAPGRGRPRGRARRRRTGRCSPSTARTSRSSSTSAEDPTVLDGADVVVEGRFVNQRVAAVPMEPNGILVEPDRRRRSLVHRADPGAVRRA